MAEPNYLLNNLLLPALAAGCFYLGIYIRKRVLPGRGSPPLGDQCLLGIPIFLIVVSPMLPVLARTVSDWTLFVTLGLIMEQGMILNETATARLKQALGKLQSQGT